MAMSRVQRTPYVSGPLAIVIGVDCALAEGLYALVGRFRADSLLFGTYDDIDGIAVLKGWWTRDVRSWTVLGSLYRLEGHCRDGGWRAYCLNASDCERSQDQPHSALRLDKMRQ